MCGIGLPKAELDPSSDIDSPGGLDLAGGYLFAMARVFTSRTRTNLKSWSFIQSPSQRAWWASVFSAFVAWPGLRVRGAMNACEGASKSSGKSPPSYPPASPLSLPKSVWYSTAIRPSS
jgi:hypothetical protein